jgi:hypothetical protein
MHAVSICIVWNLEPPVFRAARRAGCGLQRPSVVVFEIKAFGYGPMHYVTGVNVETCAQMRIFECIEASICQCEPEQ